MQRYHHLSNEERFYIHQAVREGKSNVEIARALGRHAATIGREQRRNMWPSAQLYTHEQNATNDRGLRTDWSVAT